MTVLHNKIKQLRKERKINQQELADFLGIERTSLSKIENMEYNPSAKTMLKVCEFFDLSIGDIFFNKSVSSNDTKEAI
ncbi:helix-turn-helix transcriptional regulator [Oceanobacillus luteolus]|uniref:helix-turn-helix transcriptional regulator n=1 Tax=Oceanobacillus luteolus TaxID=1274358 RepID=UPI00203B4830|nr:helix-turn-helix transcriptional regulator [Oceanobacillus luteolus]MCM3739189.1 helix-turn-helix transcriptional regulator [Oceanobacillus luteolus]